MRDELTLDKATAIAVRIERNWIEATVAGDAKRLAALFTDDIVFLGSNPRIYIGKDELLDYLAGVPMGVPMTISFGGRKLRLIGSTAFTATSYVTFAMTGEDGGTNRFRWAISWTIVALGDGWRIIQHHASSRPEE